MPRNDRLRQHRIARNWRQQDVADHLNIALITIQRWERGSQQPSAYYRVKLCALFSSSAQELGLIEDIPSENDAQETEQPAAVPSTEVALWTIPHARNSHFTGRDELLDQITQRFSPTDADQPGSIRQTALTQAQAIKGLGGIGKTQIAVEYAYRAREQGSYLHTLWINAASEEAILTCFVGLAQLLPHIAAQRETEPRKLVEAAKRWLETGEHPWLLIVDNADDLSLVQPYLPGRGNGHILLTTRASAVGSVASSVEVDMMSVMEGTHLLLHRAQRLAKATDDEINEAGNLVVALGQFPLALDQAGAYIEETGCRVSDYLQLYQEHRHALLTRRGKQTTGYPEPVATTWSLSFQQVEQTNPAAAELLQLCAFLAPDHIPEELLTGGAQHWPASLQAAVADRFTFNEMLETLLSFSLVKRLAEDRLLSLHRLVQVAQRERMTQQEQYQWTERVVRALNTVFPRDPKDAVHTWPQCQRYLEQVQACDTLVREHQIMLTEAADVLDRTGTYLRERVLYPLAEPLYLHALSIREQQVGSEHLDTAETLNNLALLYYKQGKYAQAEPLYLWALHIREQHLGPDHPDIANSLTLLSLLYYRQGKYDLAEPLYLRGMRTRELQLGPDHPDMVYPLINLGNLYYQQSKYSQAELLYLRALHIAERQVGSDHLLIAYPLTGLATLYSRLGKHDLAEQFGLRAIYLREQQLGAEHSQLAYPLHAMANLYFQQGRYQESEPLFQRALHIRMQQLGPDHLETADVLHDFAGFQQAQDHISEATLLYQRALTIREHILGTNHPSTIATRERLNAIWVILGQTQEIKQSGKDT